jgi:hypothetical protein
MLSESWRGKLPRNGYPSDTDMLFDNNGYILFCEFKNHEFSFSDLSTGQRLLYKNLIKNSPKQSVALCYHNAPENRAIDTLTDVVSFRWVYMSGGEIVESEKMTDWEQFVKRWYATFGFPLGFSNRMAI